MRPDVRATSRRIASRRISSPAQTSTFRLARLIATLRRYEAAARSAGADATRFFYLVRSNDQHLEFDIDPTERSLAVRDSREQTCSLCYDEEDNTCESVFLQENPHFEEIEELLGPMDVCLMPVGAYKPSFLMQKSHLNPHEAVRAYNILRGGTFIPMHYGTFDLSDEPASEPVRLLEQIAATGLMSGLKIPAIGEPVLLRNLA